MFAIDPSLRHIRATRDQVVSIAESINQPHVAVPGKPAQNAQAFVVGMRNANGSFSVFIYLWLVQSREQVIYALEKKQLPLEQYKDAESEAMNFCESMGFMTDNVNFRNLGPAAQDELMKRLPPFHADPARLMVASAGAGNLQSSGTQGIGPIMSSPMAIPPGVPPIPKTPGPYGPSMFATPGPFQGSAGTPGHGHAGSGMQAGTVPISAPVAPIYPPAAAANLVTPAAPMAAVPAITAEQAVQLARLLGSF